MQRILLTPVNGWLRRPSPLFGSYCSHAYPVRRYSLCVLLTMFERNSSYISAACCWYGPLSFA